MFCMLFALKKYEKQDVIYFLYILIHKFIIIYVTDSDRVKFCGKIILKKEKAHVIYCLK